MPVHNMTQNFKNSTDRIANQCLREIKMYGSADIVGILTFMSRAWFKRGMEFTP